MRAGAATIGLGRERAERLATAASELARNQLAHVGRGEATIRRVSRAGTAGLEVVALDRGNGIAHPTEAMRGVGDAASTRGGLGVGLAAAHRLTDELDVDVRAGEGTSIAARTFVEPLPRSEIAVVARPAAGEAVIGDDGLFLRHGDDLLCAVADGLGHGPLAREASAAAMAVLREGGHRPLVTAFESCAERLSVTRGAVMSVVRLNGQRELIHAGVGNVTAHLHPLGAPSRRFAATAGIVGGRGPRPRLHQERLTLATRYVLVMFTDGLPTGLDLAADPALLREPALIIADQARASALPASPPAATHLSRRPPSPRPPTPRTKGRAASAGTGLAIASSQGDLP